MSTARAIELLDIYEMQTSSKLDHARIRAIRQELEEDKPQSALKNEQKTSDVALMRMAHQIQACATPESQRALMREMQGRIERLEAWQKEQESDSVGMNYLLLATNLADLASQVNKLAKMAVSEKERPVRKSETDLVWTGSDKA
ncbi:hypothetical protein M0R72_21010 [Candidatus Pacearchaeota archaeon]|jgi:hypothetical protein|nr:hypothetical protein [Candidatus Pacearchaeota archaeon]